ncbi:hypothetical protein [Bifidobacterium olomucense]|uniref:Uncharacterized protein n=1 Tax=Bifidobacterium olomucense TaxID=2675324 RepID=A0A7Y0EXW4_9BIFI|nr:hypothetical protein [Bifidobacterium sp. DSM 109959]NMM98098.1 hypothetical protein [Bifidobacterium sp. DSM 109959]
MVDFDAMTDAQFIEHCRNGGDTTGVIYKRPPRCDWCGSTVRVDRTATCRNCRVRMRRREDPEFAQHLRDVTNARNARNREKVNRKARQWARKHPAKTRAIARNWYFLHREESAAYHKKYMAEHPEKKALYLENQRRKRQESKEKTDE